MDKLPTTPHRRSNSITSNSSVSRGFDPVEEGSLPLFNEVLNPQVLAEFSDGMATFDMNMQQLSRIHESLSNFNETFAGLLHGMKMSAWCMDFPEAPTSESFKRDRTEIDLEPEPESVIPTKAQTKVVQAVNAPEFDTTYMTNDDVSFVSKPTPKKVQKLPRVAMLVGSGAKKDPMSKTTSRNASSRPASSMRSRIPAPVQSSSRIPTSRGAVRKTRSTSTKTVAAKVNSWR